MDESGIQLGVMMGRSSEGTNFNAGNTNASAAALMKQYPDRFRALAAIEPRALNAVEQIEQWTSQDGFVGVCMDPGWSIPSLYPDDEVIDPVYKYCEEHDLIVSIALSPPICKDLSYVDPLHVQKVAQKFPKLKIVIPHGAFPFFHTAISVAIFCPNVYLLPDLYLALPGAYMADDLVTAANYFAKGKILFASSYPAVGMGQSVRAWKSRKFSEEGLRLAMYESAARLLIRLLNSAGFLHDFPGGTELQNLVLRLRMIMASGQREKTHVFWIETSKKFLADPFSHFRPLYVVHVFTGLSLSYSR